MKEKSQPMGKKLAPEKRKNSIIKPWVQSGKKRGAQSNWATPPSQWGSFFQFVRLQ